jgi:hypothetical protein
LSHTRAAGKVEAIGACHGRLQRLGLSFAARDRGKAEPDPLLEDDAGLAARLAEATGNGDAGKRR